LLSDGPGLDRVCLVVADDREQFYMSSADLTREESSTATARLYGNVVEELVVQGTHMDVCTRCMTADVNQFNSMCRRWLDLERWT